MFTIDIDNFENLDKKSIINIVDFIRSSVKNNQDYSVQTMSIGCLINNFRIDIYAFEREMPSPFLRELDIKSRFYIAEKSEYLGNEIILNKFILQAFAAVKQILLHKQGISVAEISHFYNLSDDEIINQLTNYIGFNPIETK